MLNIKYLKYISLSITLILFSVNLSYSASPSLSREKRSYKKVLKEWTEKDKVYKSRNFIAAIHWQATWLNPEVIEAQESYYKKIYQSEPNQDHFISRIKKESAKYHLFFVSFYSGEKKYYNLDDPKAEWRLVLNHDNQTLDKPIIESMGKHSKPLHQLLYPYQTNWSRGYYIKFPKLKNGLSEGQNLNLSIFGPIGNSTLTWKN